MNLPALEDVLKGVPIPQVILLFGGLFVIASIFNNGNYIYESFTTFIYGVLSSYVRIVRKDKQMGYWSYFFIQVLLFGIWAVIIIGRSV